MCHIKIIYISSHIHCTERRYFLRITIIGSGPEEYRQWFGWVESKLRFLVLKLEQVRLSLSLSLSSLSLSLSVCLSVSLSVSLCVSDCV